MEKGRTYTASVRGLTGQELVGLNALMTGIKRSTKKSSKYCSLSENKCTRAILIDFLQSFIFLSFMLLALHKLLARYLILSNVAFMPKKF